MDHKYVQDFLKENDSLLKGYLHDSQGSIYICGNLSMCNGVNELIKREIFLQQEAHDEEDIEKMFQKL